ncbi:hypothetical protein [Candidatus Palauibacter sp.]|uniref:hypothetical protein n=1 Tax=Candidatus Palauibacter sp. TaxID=3101350 RepID=UPI003D0C82C0
MPPLERLGAAELLSLIHAERYFVLHAPRQTGKTSALLALRDLLNGGAEGEYRCAYINVEPAQTAREDVGRAMGAIAAEIAREAEDTLTRPSLRRRWRRCGSRRAASPWLVNALGREMCFPQGPLRPRDGPISEQDVFEAREMLILSRETHLDQLADKLREDRVRRVIEPLLSGGDAAYSDRDFEYVRDLGLVAPDPPLRIANPIYGEVLPRELTWRP